jgi:subtilase family serine protease
MKIDIIVKERRVQCRIASILITGVLFLSLFMATANADYNWNGFPLQTAAQGQVQGQVLTFETLGLQNAPMSCEFDLPGDVQWARVYTGVWGGTPDYRGWAQVQVNDHLFDKTTLYGKSDSNDNVYVTGYGVYFLYFDATTLLKKGHNTVVVNTSQRDPESKIDGRIYTLMVVAAVKEPGGTTTKYWISDGNINLHGSGWTAGTNPDTLDQASVSFSGVDTSNIKQANLTTMELTSTKGLPDYILFNNNDLGVAPSDPENYATGAKDMADEDSFDANGGQGILGRYVDIESFDVTSMVKSDNTVTFLRGKDMNGDGEISSSGDLPEGEDYLHPVFAMLTIQSASTAATGTDLEIEDVTVKNAYENENATITATLKNLGSASSSSADVTFSVDGKTISTQSVTLDKSGIQQVSADWKAIDGDHTIKVEASIANDVDASNNAATTNIKVGSLPDLILTLSAPINSGGTPTEKSGTSWGALMAAACIAIAALLISLRPPGKRRTPAILLIAGMASLVLLALTIPNGVSPAALAQQDTNLYLLPVSIQNTGGSDTASFNVSVYIDGNKATMKTVDGGVKAGATESLQIPIYTSQGKHKIKAVADESGAIKELSKSNNVAEADYDFP